MRDEDDDNAVQKPSEPQPGTEGGASDESKQKSTSLFEFLKQNPTVDIDKFKVRVLLLVKNVQKVEPSSTYLNRRGWESFTTNNVKEALKAATTFKPDFFLVSVNVAHPKIEVLPAAISQTLKIPVMIFGEVANTLTRKYMQTIHADYKLHGKVSGPNLHRRIKQILVEATQTGESKAPTEPAQVEQGDHLIQELSQSGNKKADLGYRFEVTGQKENTPDYVQISSPNDDDSDRFVLHNSDRESASQGSMSDEDRFNLQSTDPAQETSEISQESGSQVNNRALEGNKTAAGDKSRYLVHEAPDRGELTDDHSVNPLTLEKSGTGDQELIRSENNSAVAYSGKVDLERICREAVTNYVTQNKGRGSEITEIDLTTVISATDGAETGYFLLFHAGGTDLLESMSEYFIEQLDKLAKKYGHAVEISEHVMATVESHGFPGFISGEAFSFRLMTAFGEIAVKFVRAVEETPEVAPVPGHEKVKVNVTDLVPEQPAGVDVFMYLPINMKYVRILGERSKISRSQHERIRKAGKELFIESDRVGDYVRNQKRNRTIALVCPPKNKKRSAA